MGGVGEAIGKQLKFGETAGIENLRDENEVFEIDCFYNLQKQVIDAEIKKRLSEKSGEERLNMWNSLKGQIKTTYCNEPKFEMKEYEEAEKGWYKKNCPDKKELIKWRILFWIAVLFESSILIVQGLLSGDFNPFVIVLAFLLGVGGFFQGQWLGALFHANWLRRVHMASGTEKTTMELILGIVGTILILFVAAIRAIGSYDQFEFLNVFFLTIFLGEVVSIAEAVFLNSKKKMNFCILKQEQACKVRAAKRHESDLEKMDRDIDGYLRGLKEKHESIN